MKNTEAFTRELTIAMGAGSTVLFVKTNEPNRVMETLRELSHATSRDFMLWNMLNGWSTYKPNDDPDEVTSDGTKEIQKAVAMITDIPLESPVIAAVQWAHWALPRMPTLIQLLSDMSKTLCVGRTRVVMVVPHEFDIPPEIANVVRLIEYATPDTEEMLEVLETSLGYIQTEKIPPLSTEDKKQIANMCAGLTEGEAETAICTALVVHKELLPNIGVAEILEQVSLAKVEVVKKSDVLTLMDSCNSDEIGGLQDLKDWIRKTALCMTEEALESGVDKPKGVMLVGPPGCKVEGTMLTYKRGTRNSGRKITIEDLYNKFNGLGSYACPVWDLSVDTYLHSWDANTGNVFYNKIVSVHKTGSKPYRLITTDSCGDVGITYEDGVLLNDGTFKLVKEVMVGDKILVRGSMKPVANGKPAVRRKRVSVSGLPYYRSGSTKTVTENGNTYTYIRQVKSRLVVEAHMNKMTYDEYIDALKNNSDLANRLEILGQEYEVHHMDEDPTNDELSNLKVMLKNDHKELHNQLGTHRFNVEYTRVATVTSVEDMPVKNTYDVQMEDPCANFCVNDGIIVHNTGKSVTSQAISGIMKLPLIKYDVSRVFGSLVGQSEGKAKLSLKMIASMAPCVVLLDEIDKVFQMNSGGGDSGVGQRILGTLLTFMQENKGGVFWVVTANRVDNLPPEMLRKGRLDEIFSVTVPNEEEREAVLRIHLQKRKRDPDTITDLNVAVEATAGYVPAELESAIIEACKDSYVDKVPVTGALIAKQLANIKPLSVAFAEQFSDMQEWAEMNARPASKFHPVAATRSRTRSRNTGALGGGKDKRVLDSSDLDG